MLRSEIKRGKATEGIYKEKRQILIEARDRPHFLPVVLMGAGSRALGPASGSS